MSNYWMSWNHHDGLGSFEYHGPWWVSGTGDGYETVCAAVQGCESDAEVCAKIMRTFDEHPMELDIRFIERRPDNWSPFSDRFRRADWMRWQDQGTSSDD